MSENAEMSKEEVVKIRAMLWGGQMMKVLRSFADVAFEMKPRLQEQDRIALNDEIRKARGIIAVIEGRIKHGW